MPEDIPLSFLSNSASDIDREAEARFNEAISRYFEAEFALEKGRDTDTRDASQKAEMDGYVPTDFSDAFDFSM
jgi:hypothetical protein